MMVVGRGASKLRLYAESRDKVHATKEEAKRGWFSWGSSEANKAKDAVDEKVDDAQRRKHLVCIQES